MTIISPTRVTARSVVGTPTHTVVGPAARTAVDTTMTCTNGLRHSSR